MSGARSAHVSIAVAVVVWAAGAGASAAASPRWSGDDRIPPDGRGSAAALTTSQPKRGELAYQRDCARCHLDNLKGSEMAPALAGAAFLANWRGKTARALYGRILSTMPSDDPGRLTPPDVLDIVVFVLQMNHVPVGGEDVSLEAAQNIPIARP